MDLEVTILLSKICALCEEEGHVVMDCPFVPFHINVSITWHVELQNVVVALMDQPQEQEPWILIVYNILIDMGLKGQLGPHSR